MLYLLMFESYRGTIVMCHCSARQQDQLYCAAQVSTLIKPSGTSTWDSVASMLCDDSRRSYFRFSREVMGTRTEFYYRCVTRANQLLWRHKNSHGVLIHPLPRDLNERGRIPKPTLRNFHTVTFNINLLIYYSAKPMCEVRVTDATT